MKKDLVEDIKARLSIEEVVGGYLDLKRSGDGYKALSPFKAEKTPSLVVTPAKDIWKDFSSGKGGSLFNFVMEYEGVDFKGALDILAPKAGLNPDDYKHQRGASKKTQNLKKESLEVLKIAADFYTEQFKNSVQVRQYVKKRGFHYRTIKDFQFGYAPDNWQALCEHFKSLNILPRQANAAGLIKMRPIPAWIAAKEKTTLKQRWGDFFGERLMIPLSDPQGQIIGFTGRILTDKEGAPKYINSRQTIVYDKSKHVFGYFQAKDAIRQVGFALVVEGNLDVVACHQAGYKQTVAAAGTALTVGQLKIIGRLTNDVRLAFDGDAAGIAAMERSLQAAQTAKVDLSIISLPENCDPDDLIKQNLNLWKKIVQNYQPAPQWLFERYKSQLNLKEAKGKKSLTNIMLPIINCLNDEIEKDHYLKELEKLGISRTSLDKKMKKLKEDQTQAPLGQSEIKQPEAFSEPAKIEVSPAVDKDSKIHLLLGLLLVEPQLRSHLNEKISQRLEIILSDYKYEYKLYKFLQKTTDAIDNPKSLPKNLQSLKRCVTLSLVIIKKTEKGLYLKDDLETKEQAFGELFKQLDNLQIKDEVRKKLNKL